MFHGMVQNKSLEDLFHSIVEGAVEAESKFICAALQRHLGGPMSRDKGPRTKEACMFHGRVQDKSLDLFRSVVQGAVEAEEKIICAAMQYHLGGPMSRDEGPPPMVLAVRVSARRCRPGAPRRQRRPRELTRGPQRRAKRSSQPLATGLS